LATVTELTTPGTNGYSRQTVTFAAPGGDGTSETSGAVTFGPFSSDLGNITHLFLTPEASATTGEVWIYWSADTARDPASGDSITIDAGAVTYSIT
jgi:hypothetical protein